MITKNQKNRQNMLRTMSIMAVALAALFLFACTSVQKSADADKIYFGKMDEPPTFNGKPAEEGFREYVNQTVMYSQILMENDITGRVFVEFIVERDGSVGNAKVVGGAHPMLEAEALRVVNSSPNWGAGRTGGRPVRMSYTLPFNFRLTNSNGAPLSVNDTSSSKKVELSENSLLLDEIEVLGVRFIKKENIVQHD